MNTLAKHVRSGRMTLLSVAIAAVLGAGAVQATDETRAQAIEQRAEMRTVGQIYASPSQVMLLQERLREDGRKPGSTGEWDDATMREVRDYQKAHGLAPTGQLDTSLLSALEMGDVLDGEGESGHFLDGLLKSDTDGSKASSTSRGTPIYVSPVHIAQIQHLLRDQGYYDGSIDGVWGEGTAAAANKYRREHGLEATPALDISLLRAMNAERAPVPKLAPGATARSTGVPLMAGPTALRSLQRELSAQGIPTGNIDGAWGEDTKRGVKEFQRKHELEPTGTLTLPTLAALGIDVTHDGKQAFDSRTAPVRDRMKDKDPDAVATSKQD
jgi:peptidoglycan hydrolase-like protein with peptidoglycan-binding domain